MLPEIGLDEERVQFRALVFAWQHGCEAGEDAGAVGDEDVSGRDLGEWEVDRVRMRDQGVAIVRVRERRATLQGFERGNAGRIEKSDGTRALTGCGTGPSQQ